jgi:uncharacterized protein (TIGR03663 family)
MPTNFDLDRPIFGRVRLEHLVHLAILSIAVVLRLWGLGVRPLHHDESIHAYFSWRILTSGPSDYRYDPVYHGPVLYYLTALFEGLLGPSDASARIFAVTSGLGLIALAWPLRALIGRREAIFYAVLLTVSPTIGYYSRSLRHDVPIAFFTLAAVVAFLHFLRSGRRRHAYLAGVAIGLAAATKEDIYLSAFVFANVLWVVGVVPGGEAAPGGSAGARRWAELVSTWLVRAYVPLATATVIALTIAVTFYTSLLSRPEEWNATARALRYWWGQHEVQRIGGPWWYYLPLEIGYEALIFLPALATLWRVAAGEARSRVEVMLAAWMVLAFALYAWAQEKVPWLLIPVLLPQALASACALARLRWQRLLAWAPLFAFTLWSLLASNYLYDAPRTDEHPAEAHFEPIVYVQSTYDVARVVAEIEAVARTLGTGVRTPIVVVGNATWPLSWYLRNYSVHWNSLPAETRAPVLIVDPEQAARLKSDLGDRYAVTRFAVRGWWQIDWSRITPRALARFLFERRVWNATGTTDAVMLVAKNLTSGTVLPAVRLAPAPTPRDYSAAAAAARGRVIGSSGAAPGELAAPRGLAFDRDGNLLVADSGNNRIQKLSRDGQPIAVWGGPDAGDGPGQFRQPCGVAEGPDGSVYVADTWNHRIQKLDPEGRALLEWREHDPPFWGPRSVAVAPGGTVFVADTGNKRILAYDGNGRRLLAFGGEGAEPGRFVEPVGLALDPLAKLLYVADTGNHRVQVFDLEGTFRHAWAVYGWQEFYTEPYLAWHAGMLWTTDSFNHRINAYDPLGNLRASIGSAAASPLGRPLGIAVAPDGQVFVSDFTANHIVVLDAESRAAG